MGPQGLTPQIPAPDDRYWSLLPAPPNVEGARAMMRQLVAHVATVRGAPEPAVFHDAELIEQFAAPCEALDDVYCMPELFGATWEVLMTPADRRGKGSHFTPIDVARTVSSLAFDALLPRRSPSGNRAARDVTVWDPSAGGGAFLLAAARLLHEEFGVPKSTVVANLYASDIDPGAVDVCRAALEVWAPDAGRPNGACVDSLLDHPATWPQTFTAVLGNPPFLGQLTTDTGRDGYRRAQLQQEFASAARGYVDESALFLYRAMLRTDPGGTVALILPESLLATRDAAQIRANVDQMAEMHTLWVDHGQSFAAAVDVVAPIFTVVAPERASSAGSTSSPTSRATHVVLGHGDATLVSTNSDGEWAALLAILRGVPDVDGESAVAAGGDTVGDLALVTAGFRQHFYGIADAVREAEKGEPNALTAPGLVTSGAIDPLELRWGSRPVKFARQQWRSPVVELTAVDDVDVRNWFTDRMVPKILLASQTRVIEAVVDEAARLVPSVPVLSVEPKRDADLWKVAAVLCSPFASAWIARRAAGTGLSEAALRIRASEVALIPLPSDHAAWNAGSEAARKAQSSSARGAAGEHADALRELADCMDAAYGGLGDSVTNWWWERLRLPEDLGGRAY